MPQACSRGRAPSIARRELWGRRKSMPGSTSVGCQAAGGPVRLAIMGSAGFELEDARLLPTMLVPSEGAGRARRSRRDWVVDIAAVVISLVFGASLLQAEAAHADP